MSLSFKRIPNKPKRPHVMHVAVPVIVFSSTKYLTEEFLSWTWEKPPLILSWGKSRTEKRSQLLRAQLSFSQSILSIALTNTCSSTLPCPHHQNILRREIHPFCGAKVLGRSKVWLINLEERDVCRRDRLKSPTGPTKPEYLIAGSQITYGFVGKVPFNS